MLFSYHINECRIAGYVNNTGGRSHYQISLPNCNLYALKDMMYHKLSSQNLVKKHFFAKIITTVTNPLQDLHYYK